MTYYRKWYDIWVAGVFDKITGARLDEIEHITAKTAESFSVRSNFIGKHYNINTIYENSDGTPPDEFESPDGKYNATITAYLRVADKGDWCWVEKEMLDQGARLVTWELEDESYD